MSVDRLGGIFLHMKDRCYNPNSDSYKHYGARGITICEEWYTPHSHKGSRVFRKWALENGYADNLTIDRIDVNKGYSPDNCRWIPRSLQNRNKRNNRFITYNGKTQTIAEWSKELKIPTKTLQYRLNKQMPIEKLFSKKSLSLGKQLNEEERKSISERIKKFMNDPIKKAKWKESLSKRKYNVKGLRWFTNGVVTIRARECPVGFHIGKGRSNNKTQDIVL